MAAEQSGERRLPRTARRRDRDAVATVGAMNAHECAMRPTPRAERANENAASSDCSATTRSVGLPRSARHTCAPGCSQMNRRSTSPKMPMEQRRGFTAWVDVERAPRRNVQHRTHASGTRLSELMPNDERCARHRGARPVDGVAALQLDAVAELVYQRHPGDRRDGDDPSVGDHGEPRAKRAKRATRRRSLSTVTATDRRRTPRQRSLPCLITDMRRDSDKAAEWNRRIRGESRRPRGERRGGRTRHVTRGGERALRRSSAPSTTSPLMTDRAPAAGSMRTSAPRGIVGNMLPPCARTQSAAPARTASPVSPSMSVAFQAEPARERAARPRRRRIGRVRARCAGEGTKPRAEPGERVADQHAQVSARGPRNEKRDRHACPVRDRHGEREVPEDRVHVLAPRETHAERA